MSYSQQFISDHFEDNSAVIDLLKEISALGFDPVKEKPTVLSLYQTKEGYEYYEELRHHVEVAETFNRHGAALSFIFRSVRDEDETVFKLNDIEVQLYVLDQGKPKKLTETSFGKTRGFPKKEGMIKETLEKAKNLSRAQFTNNHLKASLQELKNPLIKKRKGIK